MLPGSHNTATNRTAVLDTLVAMAPVSSILAKPMPMPRNVEPQ